MSRLALGTAQFGSNYGVANKGGKVLYRQTQDILELAMKSGIDTIDTAASYGDSEKVLGSLGTTKFRVVTKLGPLLPASSSIEDTVQTKVKGALERLDLTSIYGLLIHNTEDLFGPNGKALVASLMRLKDIGLIGKVGVSVYEPQELRRVMKVALPDLVQLPLNLVDRRFARDGLLGELYDKGIEIHSRSAFLQGLLLMPLDDLPEKFHRWYPLFKRWDTVKQQSRFTQAALCLSYPLSFSEIARVVVGVDNLRQLTELLDAECQDAANVDLSFLESSDLTLINPSKWGAL